MPKLFAQGKMQWGKTDKDNTQKDRKKQVTDAGNSVARKVNKK